MDFDTGENGVATDYYNFHKFDSSDFSTKLVTVHTSLEDLEYKSISPPNEINGKEHPLEGAKLLHNLEYNELRQSTTSFNKWHSQTSLLEDLVNEDSDLRKNDFNSTNGTSENNVPVKEDDDTDHEFDFLFDKSDDGNIINNPVLTFLLNNFSKVGPDKPLNLREDLAKEFGDFKKKFLQLVERVGNDLKFKKVLLTVAFNHYGGSTVPKYMTSQEYTNLLNAHRVFKNEAVSKLVFESMDRKHKSMVTRSEFMSGMLSCSPEAKHNPSTVFGKLRLQHIFRAYDANRVGYLDHESLNLMQSHVEQLMGNRMTFDQKLNEKLLNMFNGKLSYDSFYYCIENNLLKNTNVLFRSTHDLGDVLKHCLLKAFNNVEITEKPSYIDTGVNKAANREYSRPYGSHHELFHHGNAERSALNHESINWTDVKMSKNSSGMNRSSLWSHTPRVYSEFTHNRSPSRDPYYGFNYENKWTSQETSPKTIYERQIDRLSKMYNEHPHEDEVVEEYKQSEYGNYMNEEKQLSQMKSDDSTEFKNLSPEKYDLEGETSEKDVHKESGKEERKEEVVREEKVNGLDDKPPYQASEDLTPSRFNKIDEFLREYEHSYKTPDYKSSTETQPIFTNLDSFKDAVEDEAQMVDQYKEQSDVFKSFDTLDEVISNKSHLDGLLHNEYRMDNKMSIKPNMNKLVNGQVKVNHSYDSKRGIYGNLGYSDEKEYGHLNGANESQLRNGGVGVKRNDVKAILKYPNELAIDTFTQHLSKRYKHKFLVSKGHLIEESVAKGLFKNYLAHSLGESTDHASLRLCSYSDMLQLCDSVCSILKREDSLLHLRGDFQVFATLNGDLSCLLDLFNSYGWPMMNNRWSEHEKMSNMDFKKWTEFDYCYLFMGGFVSELSSFSLEFVLLMFALKVLFPYHVHFLRSSKDERNITNNAGFYHEIYVKLSENHASLRLENNETLLLQCAKELFHRINDVFEFMSVGAILNEEILCVDKLTKNFSYKKLGNMPKPLNLSTCTHEQIYDLLFNKLYFSFPTCNCATDYCEDHPPEQHGNLGLVDKGAKDGPDAKPDSNSRDEGRVAGGSDRVAPELNGCLQGLEGDNDGDERHSDLKEANKSPLGETFQKHDIDPSYDAPLKYNDQNASLNEATWELGDSENFSMVICSSDELDSGFKYLFNNKLLLLSTNFLTKSGDRVASYLVFSKNKVTHRSLRL